MNFLKTYISISVLTFAYLIATTTSKDKYQFYAVDIALGSIFKPIYEMIYWVVFFTFNIIFRILSYFSFTFEDMFNIIRFSLNEAYVLFHMFCLKTLCYVMSIKI